MDKNGKLIILEGLDGSGKSTQAGLLTDSLTKQGKRFRQLKFPDYNSKSSSLVTMYLDGEIGGVEDVNLYAATSFYACDRYISYKTDWRRDYLAGTVLLCDRYATSNLIYQMAKLPRSGWDSYIKWLWDYEFVKLGLPEPDLVIYLDMHPDTSRALLEKRYMKSGGGMDIHERDVKYLLSCREAALYAAEKLDWRVLRCCDGKKPLSAETVSELVADIADSVI
ncbi:MAG: deoxynucleoside kinase [Oscillospiraceae bacterium]|nr:deoxynucleoside kinase [Oscillospiraceae bacterium]